MTSGLGNDHYVLDHEKAIETHPDWLGKVVRFAWLDWCRDRATQGHPLRPDHLASWEEMPEHEREVDRRIGVMVYRALRLRAPKTPATVCHFCGRGDSDPEVKVLAAGLYALICDKCVALAQAKIVDQEAAVPGTASLPPPSAADRACLYVLRAAQRDPDGLGYHLGPGTESFGLLCAAVAERTGETVGDVSARYGS